MRLSAKIRKKKTFKEYKMDNSGFLSPPSTPPLDISNENLNVSFFFFS